MHILTAFLNKKQLIFEYWQCNVKISHDSHLTLGMTGSFGGFMPGSMGGGSPFGSMQVGLRNNYFRDLDLPSFDITWSHTEQLFFYHFFSFQYKLRQLLIRSCIDATQSALLLSGNISSCKVLFKCSWQVARFQ